MNHHVSRAGADSTHKKVANRENSSRKKQSAQHAGRKANQVKKRKQIAIPLPSSYRGEHTEKGSVLNRYLNDMNVNIANPQEVTEFHSAIREIHTQQSDTAQDVPYFFSRYAPFIDDHYQLEETKIPLQEFGKWLESQQLVMPNSYHLISLRTCTGSTINFGIQASSNSTGTIYLLFPTITYKFCNSQNFYKVLQIILAGCVPESDFSTSKNLPDLFLKLKDYDLLTHPLNSKLLEITTAICFPEKLPDLFFGGDYEKSAIHLTEIRYLGKFFDTEKPLIKFDKERFFIEFISVNVEEVIEEKTISKPKH